MRPLGASENPVCGEFINFGSLLIFLFGWFLLYCISKALFSVSKNLVSFKENGA